MLKLTNVDSYYDRSHILHAVCLDIPLGKVTAVLGRNGTGKTTLLKTLMGLTDRMEGQISLDGIEIGKDPTFRRARAGIAYVPQGREIIPDFSIPNVARPRLRGIAVASHASRCRRRRPLSLLCS